MNFHELLNVAGSNKEEAQYQASVKRYSSQLPPPKKNQKSGVQSDGVRKFLEKKKADEAAKVAEAQKLKEQLLTLRAQSTKNNKKAKIMASRTKDNDFSRIRLTDDEIQSKKKIEIELQRKHLATKMERMKARIEMEEKEKLLPRKRKRKSKQGTAEVEDDSQTEERIREEVRDSRDDFRSRDKGPTRKPPRPPPPSFSELLKVAKVKQHEPVVIPKKKKEEERLLTKKERKIYEEEQERLRRKQERLQRGESVLSARPTNQVKHSSNADQGNMLNGRSNVKKPMVIHVEKDPVPAAMDQPQRFKIPKAPTSSKSTPIQKTIDKNRTHGNKLPTSSLPPKPPTNHDREKVSERCVQGEKTSSKQNMHNENRPLMKKPQMADKPVKKKSGVKVAPPAPVMTVDTDAIAAAIEKRLRERLEKEMEEKFAAKFATMQKYVPEPSSSKPNKVKPGNTSNGITVNGKSHVNGKVISKLPNNPPPNNRKDGFKVPYPKPPMTGQRRPGPPPPPAKKPFHPNPYLDPPRRRLEPQRPQRPPPRRRIESDEEDDDDDDMSDFIDDRTSQNDDEYSEYIKEIFGYDKNKYIDDDDDDIMETSFAEQMKEETRSAKLGYLEDLEEERKLKEMEKKRKKKLKK